MSVFYPLLIVSSFPPRDGPHDRRHEEREQQDRRRDVKDRRKDGRAGEQGERYRQSPVNGRRDYSDKDSYRGSRERLNDLQQTPAQGGPEPEGEGRLDRRGGSRHHRGERSTKDQRRSPSRERDRDRFGGKDVPEDLQFSRHRILIDHASDTQAEDPRDTIIVDPNDKKQHLDPSSAGGRTRNNRKKLETMLRNDSLSSDPSDCVRPPPPKPHKHKRGKKQRQQSISSSDDEIQSTPECSSCEEVDLESESVSEKGQSPVQFVPFSVRDCCFFLSFKGEGKKGVGGSLVGGCVSRSFMPCHVIRPRHVLAESRGGYVT